MKKILVCCLIAVFFVLAYFLALQFRFKPLEGMVYFNDRLGVIRADSEEFSIAAVSNLVFLDAWTGKVCYYDKEGKRKYVGEEDGQKEKESKEMTHESGRVASTKKDEFTERAGEVFDRLVERDVFSYMERDGFMKQVSDRISGADLFRKIVERGSIERDEARAYLADIYVPLSCRRKPDSDAENLFEDWVNRGIFSECDYDAFMKRIGTQEGAEVLMRKMRKEGFVSKEEADIVMEILYPGSRGIALNMVKADILYDNIRAVSNAVLRGDSREEFLQALKTPSNAIILYSDLLKINEFGLGEAGRGVFLRNLYTYALDELRANRFYDMLVKTNRMDEKNREETLRRIQNPSRMNDFYDFLVKKKGFKEENREETMRRLYPGLHGVLPYADRRPEPGIRVWCRWTGFPDFKMAYKDVNPSALNVAKADAIYSDLVRRGDVKEEKRQKFIKDMENPEAASRLYDDLVRRGLVKEEKRRKFMADFYPGLYGMDW